MAAYKEIISPMCIKKRTVSRRFQTSEILKNIRLMYMLRVQKYTLSYFLPFGGGNLTVFNCKRFPCKSI